MKLNITYDDYSELREWVSSPSFKLFTDKVLSQFERDASQRLATATLDKEELLILRAKLEGVRDVIRRIKEIKGSLQEPKE